MKINFIYSPDVSYEQMIGYELASIIWSQLLTDDIEVNILAKTTDELDPNVIGGAIPEFHEQHYALFLQYYEADITSEEDQLAYDALQQGNTIDFLLNDELISGNTKLKLTTALAKALGMTEAISLERYLLNESEHFMDGTIMMNQDFAWDFNYLRDSEAAENTLDFLSVALHETGHILGFTSSLDFSLQEDTLYSGRTELSNFSPLDLFRFSAESLAQDNPDGAVNDLSIGGVAWFSTDGGETLTAKMSTGKEGDNFQASHWERRYDPLGIMDPTLWYQERVSITDLDLLAFDIMGYDLATDAGDVENFFTPESLEGLLAQAKVQLAHKLDITVEELENNANVPLSSSELIAEMETAYLETAATEGSNTETSSNTSTFNSDSSSGSALDSPSDKELKDFFKDLNQMMGKIYKWWASNNSSGNSSWQELYEWWASNNSSGNSSWQELYEWWVSNNSSGNSSWQELSEEELAKFHEEVAGNQPSWWQEVFFVSQADGNLEDIQLPGESQDTIGGPIYYQEFHGGHDDDIIGGDLSDDNINGKKGDDLIDGAEGDDTIVGGRGHDTIFGFDGNDSIIGGEGDDVISGESDSDALYGEAGADVLMGGDHDDYLDGGDGRDFLSGNTGDDALIGGAGDDALEGEAGKDLLVGEAGEDIGNGGSGDDFIFGDEYSESFKQAFGNNLNNLTSLFNANSPSNTETSVEDNTNSNNADNLVLAQDPLRVEAENLSWTGNYQIVNRSFASGGSLIRNNVNNQLISGTTTFTGQTGVYNIIIGYHDIEIDHGEIKFKLNGNLIDTWQLTKDLEYDQLEAANFTTHIISNVSLTTNESFTLESIVSEDDHGEGSLDYIEFIPVADNTPNTDVVIAQDPIVIEAENMNLSGGYYSDDYYYNGIVIRTSSNNPDGVASSTFSGETGYYQIKVHYIDEPDGNASLSVQIAGTEIDSWVLDQNTSGDNQYYSRTITEGMHIDANAAIEIQGQAENYEFARVDYIEFIPVEPSATNDSNDTSPTDVDLPPEPINITPELELGLNSDILRGGAGNDGIDGGAGNDIIFGEDELNDSSNITAPLIDGVFTYGHSSYILTTPGLTWEDAQAQAESYGGNLVTINDAAEEAWLKQTFGISEELWIGLTDKDAEGTFKWASGESVTYSNWVPNEPNNSGTNADYTRMNFDNSDSGWGDLSEDGQRRGIIEIDWSSVGGNDTIFGGAGDDQVYGNSGNDVIYGDSYGNSTPNSPGTLSFQQGVNGYNGTVDTTLHGYNPDAVFGNDSELVVDNDWGGQEVHTLLRFEDIFGSQSGQIGLSDTINSAVLELNVTNPVNGVAIHQLLQSWSDGDSWNSLGNGIQTDGVEAASTPIIVTDLDLGTASIDVTAIVQAWQADPSSNNGLAFLPTSDHGEFLSSEGSIAPRLEIDVNQGSSNSSVPADNINNLETLTFQQGVNGYTGTVDTILHGYNPDAVFGNDSELVVDNDWGGQEVHTLLRFEDIFGSQSGQIGLSDTINSAVLELNVTNPVNGVAIHQLLQSWSDGDSWNSLGNGIQTDGVEAASTPIIVTDLDLGTVSIDVTAIVQAWQADPSSNNGLAFLPTSDHGEFLSSEGSIAPRLVVDVKLSPGGHDNLMGNGGHDTINGGAGNDVINGTDTIVAGYLERDVLVGGAGADKFILGDDTQAYYATGGEQDYAVIKDFDQSEDTVQLYGIAADYQQRQQGDDIHLSRNGDLVAILEENSILNLNSSSFTYVSVI